MENSSKCKICQVETTQKCGKCQRVFYCSKEHQKAHWTVHKEDCHPFQVLSCDTMGRYLSATKDINKNAIILKENPIIFGPFQETQPVCLGCNQEITFKNFRKCSKCGWPVCSKKCEENPCHIPECFYTRQNDIQISIKHLNYVNPYYQCITPLRCLYQKTHNPLAWQKLMVLESRYEGFKSGNQLDQTIDLIHNYFKLKTTFSKEEITKICNIIAINSHEIPISEPPFIAIYEKTSFFEHNCVANCCKSFTNSGSILITSGTAIKNGDHLSICYTDALWNTTNRRKFLFETKSFWCFCQRCSDPTEFGTFLSGFKCQSGNCEGCLLPRSFLQMENPDPLWYCNKCDYTVSNILVNTLIEKISGDIHKLDKKSVIDCKKLFHKLKGVLTTHNFLLVEIKLMLSQLIGISYSDDSLLAGVTDEDLDLKLVLCKDLMKLTDTLITGERRLRGLILFELHCGLAEKARRIFNCDGITGEALSIFKESIKHVTECIEMLKYEPDILPEGKTCSQARKNLIEMKCLIENS